MSSFYAALCAHYDHIFPLDVRQQTFVAHALQSCRSLLEVGAATGNLTMHLAELGFDIEGVDLSADMIDRAREKAGDRPNVRFSVLDMRQLKSVFAEDSLDGIVCVGNTLVHLPDLTAVRDVLAQLHCLLVPGGRLILQIINYDRIFSKQLTGLPTIDNEHITFERRYNTHGDDEPLDFETTLTVKSTGEVLTQTTGLLPLKHATLADTLTRSGFRTIETFGSFAGDPFDAENSIQLIVICGA